jgi:hypothetical protein
MFDCKLTREEQETIIKGNAANNEWEIITADSRTIRRMEEQGYKPDDRPNQWGYVSFTVPFDRIAVRKPERRKTGFAIKKPRALHSGAVSKDQKPPAIALGS